MRAPIGDLIGEDLLTQLSSIPGQPVELPLQQTQAGMTEDLKQADRRAGGVICGSIHHPEPDP